MTIKVAVQLMSMSSAPGYISSSGSTSAIIVSAADASRCGSDSDALYELEGEQVTLPMLGDVERRTHKNGACSYETYKGTLELSGVKVVVQKERLDICTEGDVSYRAWVVNPASLKSLYEQRGKEYADLAMELSILDWQRRTQVTHGRCGV